MSYTETYLGEIGEPGVLVLQVLTISSVHHKTVTKLVNSGGHICKGKEEYA